MESKKYAENALEIRLVALNIYTYFLNMGLNVFSLYVKLLSARQGLIKRFTDWTLNNPTSNDPTFEQPNFERLNFEGLNLEWLNFERPNIKRLNLEQLNLEWLNFEKDPTSNDCT